MRIALRIAAFAAMLYCAPAYAGPSPNWDLVAPLSRPAHREPRTEAPRPLPALGPLDLTALTSHPLIAVAARYVGRSGPALGLPARLWCRDFVNFALAKAGQPPRDRSRRAIDAVRLGRRVRDPQPGDLAVMRHHVTVVVAIKGGKVIGLGGNQGRRVKLSSYDARRVLSYVRVI